MIRAGAVLLAALAVAAVIAAWAYPRQHLAFHHMRYCVSPDRTFPMHPCADDEDDDEVIQS